MPLTGLFLSRYSVKWKGYTRIQKQLITALALLFLTDPAFSQAGDGKAGIDKATELVNGYFESGTVLLYVIGAVVGLIGAVSINKWSSGDQDTSKAAAAWFGACIFLVVVATVLRSFYGL